MFRKSFGPFTATYRKGDSYINVSAMGVDIDVINIAHLPGPTITRAQFLAEVEDSKDYILNAYDMRDIAMLARY